MTVRKRTSSRIIPPEADLSARRDTFYEDMQNSFENGIPIPELVINFDQTFHLFHPTRGYTWEKKGADRVQISDSRDGFTLLPVVSERVLLARSLFLEAPLNPFCQLCRQILFCSTSSILPTGVTRPQLFLCGKRSSFLTFARSATSLETRLPHALSLLTRSLRTGQRKFGSWFRRSLI